MRAESRTRRILNAAKEALSSRYDMECIDVNAVGLPPLTPETLAERNFRGCPGIRRGPGEENRFRGQARDRGSVLGHELPGCAESVLREHVPLRHNIHGQWEYLHGTVPVQKGDVHLHKGDGHRRRQPSGPRKFLSAGSVFAVGSGRRHDRGGLESRLPLTGRGGSKNRGCVRCGAGDFRRILTGAAAVQQIILVRETPLSRTN